MNFSGKFILVLLIFSGSIDIGSSIQCYECTSELLLGEYDPCLYGDEKLLRQVTCWEPSVCAAYHYRTETAFGMKLSISRGCQALRYGSSCEDIFSELRRNNAILPGQHTCTTCSSDLCNSALTLLSSQNIILIFILILTIF